MKVCSRCKKQKHYHFFKENPVWNDGYYPYCNECKKIKTPNKISQQEKTCKNCLLLQKSLQKETDEVNVLKSTNLKLLEALRYLPILPAKNNQDKYIIQAYQEWFEYFKKRPELKKLQKEWDKITS